jgi:hypothetical protein
MRTGSMHAAVLTVLRHSCMFVPMLQHTSLWHQPTAGTCNHYSCANIDSSPRTHAMKLSRSVYDVMHACTAVPSHSVGQAD